MVYLLARFIQVHRFYMGFNMLLKYLRARKVPLHFSTPSFFCKKTGWRLHPPPGHATSLSEAATVQTAKTAFRQCAPTTLQARQLHVTCFAPPHGVELVQASPCLRRSQASASPQLSQKTSEGPRQAPRTPACHLRGSPDVHRTRGDRNRAALICKLWPR